MSQIEASIDFCFSVESHLLEKDWKTTSYLQVTECKLIDFYDLLGLAIICYESLIIYASIKIPGPSFLSRTPGNEKVFDLYSQVKNFKAADVALDDWASPLLAYLVCVQLFQECSIPSELQSSLMGFLVRIGQSRIVLVRVIESFFEKQRVISDSL